MTTRTAQTTTILVTRPTSFNQLESSYKLVRYELPSELRWRKNKNDYGQMHNCLKDQLDYPYKAFQYDRLDKNIIKWVVYVLYPFDVDPQSVTMPFLKDTPLAFREISFAQIDFHILLKLLHIAYFRGVDREQSGCFVGQDSCYVYARYDRKKGIHTCLRIDIKGDIRNEPNDALQEFKILGHARPFRRIDDATRLSNAYFGSQFIGQRRYFIHLKRSEVENAVAKNEPIYTIKTRENQRTTLAYHDLQKIEASVGKILYDFISGFKHYLSQHGIMCSSKERHFNEFIPPKQETSLSLPQLHNIHVYDNRLLRKHNLQEYIELFAQAYPEIQFKEATDLSLAAGENVLIVQDHEKDDFAEDGVLRDVNDPYHNVYKQFLNLSKQSINVNGNESEGLTAEEYLDYTLPQKTDDAFEQKMQVALSQLYLKSVILYEKKVDSALPFAPVNYLFLRKKRYYADTYETLLYVQGDKLHFLDLRDPNMFEATRNLISQLGIDWDTMEDQMLRKYRKVGDDKEAKELPSYDIVIGKGFFAELEGLDERLLYDYDEIVRRQAAVKTRLPIDELKLTPYYDTIRTATTLPLLELQMRNLLTGRAVPKDAKEHDSITFYRKLERFDAFLDDIARTHVEISYDELTQGERWEEIIRIFSIKPDKNGQYSRATFKALYQKRGWFSSDKAKDLHLYEGIWYDTDNSYMVGSAQPMKLAQPRAHLIRRFDVYTGHQQFDIKPLLLATSVQFVRLNQYTVYPYPFHLIDIFVENVLRFQN